MSNLPDETLSSSSSSTSQVNFLELLNHVKQETSTTTNTSSSTSIATRYKDTSNQNTTTMTIPDFNEIFQVFSSLTISQLPLNFMEYELRSSTTRALPSLKRAGLLSQLEPVGIGTRYPVRDRDEHYSKPPFVDLNTGETFRIPTSIEEEEQKNRETAPYDYIEDIKPSWESVHPYIRRRLKEIRSSSSSSSSHQDPNNKVKNDHDDSQEDSYETRQENLLKSLRKTQDSPYRIYIGELDVKIKNITPKLEKLERLICRLDRNFYYSSQNNYQEENQDLQHDEYSKMMFEFYSLHSNLLELQLKRSQYLKLQDQYFIDYVVPKKIDSSNLHITDRLNTEYPTLGAVSASMQFLKSFSECMEDLIARPDLPGLYSDSFNRAYNNGKRLSFHLSKLVSSERHNSSKSTASICIQSLSQVLQRLFQNSAATAADGNNTMQIAEMHHSFAKHAERRVRKRIQRCIKQFYHRMFAAQIQSKIRNHYNDKLASLKMKHLQQSLNKEMEPDNDSDPSKMEEDLDDSASNATENSFSSFIHDELPNLKFNSSKFNLDSFSRSENYIFKTIILLRPKSAESWNKPRRRLSYIRREIEDLLSRTESDYVYFNQIRHQENIASKFIDSIQDLQSIHRYVNRVATAVWKTLPSYDQKSMLLHREAQKIIYRKAIDNSTRIRDHDTNHDRPTPNDTIDHEPVDTEESILKNRQNVENQIQEKNKTLIFQQLRSPTRVLWMIHIVRNVIKTKSLWKLFLVETKLWSMAIQYRPALLRLSAALQRMEDGVSNEKQQQLFSESQTQFDVQDMLKFSSTIFFGFHNYRQQKLVIKSLINYLFYLSRVI